MKRKNGAQFKMPRKKYQIRTFLVNQVYIALLSITGVKGGYSAWGTTRTEAVKNVMNLACNYIK
jgi:hypothetical protein